MNEKAPDTRPDGPDSFAEAGLLLFESSERDLVSTLVDAVQGTRRAEAMMAACQATAFTDLVVVAQRRAERDARTGQNVGMQIREITAEISAALRVSDRTAQRLLSEAVTMTTAFPATHAALADGRISVTHARVVVDAGSAIGDDDARAGYEAKVLRIAEVESAGRLRSMAQILAARANPETIDARHRRARRNRDVRVIDGDDGMSELRTYQPTALVHGIYDRLTQMARAVQADEAAAASAAAAGDGVLDGLSDLADVVPTAAPDEDGVLDHLSGLPDVALATSPDEDGRSDDGIAPAGDVTTEPPRSIDELRADLLADLLLSGAPTGHGDGLQNIRGCVQITVPVLTLIGASDEPAVLAGHGPIDPDTARCLAATAPGWDRVMTHPVTDAVLAVDRYRPGEALKRWLRVRDPHCRFPACRMPFWRDDADHTHDAALGGPTRDDNLANLCRNHHVIKHHTRWRVRQLGGGRLEWTSPTGRVYIDVPERTLLFTADADPPPF